MTNQAQIDRIARMEQAMQQAAGALAALEAALDAGGEALPALHRLAAYYASPDWRGDFEADEAGLIPQDMPRGVLSEDGLYNLLGDWQGLKERLRALAEEVPW